MWLGTGSIFKFMIQFVSLPGFWMSKTHPHTHTHAELESSLSGGNPLLELRILSIEFLTTYIQLFWGAACIHKHFRTCGDATLDSSIFGGMLSFQSNGGIAHYIMWIKNHWHMRACRCVWSVCLPLRDIVLAPNSIKFSTCTDSYSYCSLFLCIRTPFTLTTRQHALGWKGSKRWRVCFEGKPLPEWLLHKIWHVWTLDHWKPFRTSMLTVMWKSIAMLLVGGLGWTATFCGFGAGSRLTYW